VEGAYIPFKYFLEFQPDQSDCFKIQVPYRKKWVPIVFVPNHKTINIERVKKYLLFTKGNYLLLLGMSIIDNLLSS